MSSSDDSGRRDFIKAGIAASVAAGTTLATEALARAGDPPAPAPAPTAAGPAGKEGTILRGADGKLYFIPDDALKPFALDEKKNAALEDRFGEGLKAAAATLPGKDVTDSGVGALITRNVLLVNLGALRTGAVGLKAKVVGALKANATPPVAPVTPPLKK
jgi:hypothetical protein